MKKLAREIFEHNKKVGWWDEYPIRIKRLRLNNMLIISELSEAMEGDRSNLRDTHLTDYPAFDVELADAAIRCLDFLGSQKHDFKGFDVLKNEYKVLFADYEHLKKAEQLYICCDALIKRNVFACLCIIMAVAE